MFLEELEIYIIVGKVKGMMIREVILVCSIKVDF